MFPNIFWSFLKISEDFRRFPKIAEEDPKIFRLKIDKPWPIEHCNMANSVSWLVKNDNTHVWIPFLSTHVRYHFSWFATTRYTTAVYIINAIICLNSIVIDLVTLVLEFSPKKSASSSSVSSLSVLSAEEFPFLSFFESLSSEESQSLYAMHHTGKDV